MSEYYLEKYHNPRGKIFLSKENRYIYLRKMGESHKKVYRYDLQDDKFERINYYTKHHTINPQKTDYITQWFTHCDIVTESKKFQRMYFFTKSNPHLNQCSNPVRFIEKFRDDYTKMFEVIDELGYATKEMEDLIERAKKGESFWQNFKWRLEEYYNILINKETAQNIKIIEEFFDRKITIDEIYYFRSMTLKQLKIFIALYEYANDERYDELFIQEKYNSTFNILKQDEFASNRIRDEMINTIDEYNLDINRFIQYANMLYRVEKVTLQDLFDDSHYKDYLKMQKEIKHGRISKVTKYPKNFFTVFHHTKKTYKLIKQQINEEKFHKQYLNNIHLEDFKDKKYIIKIPTHPAYIEQEGDELHHCVRSYIKPMTEGKTLIVFLRLQENINTPLVTIEVKNNKILQAYGKYDKKPTDEELDFIRKWAKNKEIEINWRW